MLNRANHLWVSVVKWLATRNPKLVVMSSNQIRRLFCDTFFFNSACFSFFVFLSLLRFFCLFFFTFFQHYFFFIFFSFQVYFKFSLQKIWHESQTSPSLDVSVFESITSISIFPSQEGVWSLTPNARLVHHYRARQNVLLD